MKTISWVPPKKGSHTAFVTDLRQARWMGWKSTNSIQISSTGSRSKRGANCEEFEVAMQIPDDKRYFRIGEASRIIGVEPYVLRYWESEFPQIRPQRADSRQRTYQRKDLEIILEIKRLLYEEKLTIEGAKRQLRIRAKEKPVYIKEVIRELKSDLREIIHLLS
jgi:DNA-binding transcriptional MerR regulator